MKNNNLSLFIYFLIKLKDVRQDYTPPKKERVEGKGVEYPLKVLEGLKIVKYRERQKNITKTGCKMVKN